MALSQPTHVVHLRISGAGAYDAIDRVFGRELYLRDGQISQGLLLGEEGSVFADCYLARDGSDFFLLAEGPNPEDVAAYLLRHFDGVADVNVTDESQTYCMVCVDGPYAWELIARLVGPEVIGLPYLTFFHFDDVVCCRTGKTGEYGYQLLVPHESRGGLWEELLRLGEALDVGQIDLAVLDACALENWFFNIRGEGSHGLTPLELQLQWRLSRRKTFVGSEALKRQRAQGITQRITCVVSPSRIDTDNSVRRDDAERGRIIHAGFSPLRGDWVGLALMDIAYAYPGVDALRIGDEDGARSVTPPVITNRSLYVNPQVHSYASRHSDDFPPLVVS
jgi:glycine cleavage system aminomethyltransferase T